jgi:hypothetical protein
MPEQRPGARPYPTHDFDWMHATIVAAGRRVRWLDEVLVIARPPVVRGATVHQPIVRCPHCVFWTWRETGAHLTAPYCPSCRAVLPVVEPVRRAVDGVLP